MKTATVKELRQSDPWKQPNAKPPAFPCRGPSGCVKCFCKREWESKVSVLLKRGYLFCMLWVFPPDEAAPLISSVLTAALQLARSCSQCRVSVHLQRHLQSCSPDSHTAPRPLFYLIFQDRTGGGKERANHCSVTFLLPPETLQFTGAVRWSWVSSCQQQPILSTSETSPGWLDKYFLFTSFSPLLDNSRVNPPRHLLSPAPWYWHLRNTELFIFHWRAHTINFHISESSYCSLLSGSIEWWQ